MILFVSSIWKHQVEAFYTRIASVIWHPFPYLSCMRTGISTGCPKHQHPSWCTEICLCLLIPFSCCGQKWKNQLFVAEGTQINSPDPPPFFPAIPSVCTVWDVLLPSRGFFQQSGFCSGIYWSVQQIREVFRNEATILGSVFLGTHTSLAWQDEKVTWEIGKWRKTSKRCTFCLRYCSGQSFSLHLWLIILAIQESSKVERLSFHSYFSMGNLWQMDENISGLTDTEGD